MQEQLNLEDALLATYQEPAPEDEEGRKGFKIDNPDLANWAVRKIAKLRAQQREVDEQTAREKFLIEAWQKQRTEVISREIGFFLGKLQEFHEQRLKANPKEITLKLPAGVLKMRAQQPDYQYDDEKLVEFLRGHGLEKYIKTITTIAPAWGELKKSLQVGPGGQVVLEETGEIMDVVSAHARPPKFDVETREG